MPQLVTVRIVASLCVALQSYAFIWALLGAYTTDAESCKSAPLLNEVGLKDEGHKNCQAYRYACVDQETIILYDPDYADRPRADGIPIAETQTLQAFFRHGKTGARLGKITEQQFNATEPIVAGTGYQNIPLPIRLAAEHEEGIEGGFPSHFSRCTLPLIIYQHWPSNYAEFFARSPVFVNAMIQGLMTRDRQPVIDRNISIVINTVLKTPLQKFHSFLMQPFSVHAVSSFAAFSSRASSTTRSPATAEGTHVRCFEKLVVCAFNHGWYPGLFKAGHAISRYYAPQLPNPSLPPATLHSKTLHVVIDKRPVLISRQIVNTAELLQWCNSGGLKVPPSSPWKKVHCSEHSFGVDLLSDVAAAQHADILVSHHGASQCNVFFTRPHSAWLELRPYEFGTKHPFMPSMWGPLITHQLSFKLFWFAVNIEDPADYVESQFEHYFKKSEEGKKFGNSETLLVQSRHLRLQPELLQFMVDKVAEVNKTTHTYCMKYYTNQVLYTYTGKGQTPQATITTEGTKNLNSNECAQFMHSRQGNPSAS